ncbi:hypothetical protein ATKI12_1103 [Kitasatospora sp. Ki12]
MAQHGRVRRLTGGHPSSSSSLPGVGRSGPAGRGQACQTTPTSVQPGCGGDGYRSDRTGGHPMLAECTPPRHDLSTDLPKTPRGPGGGRYRSGSGPGRGRPSGRPPAGPNPVPAPDVEAAGEGPCPPGAEQGGVSLVGSDQRASSGCVHRRRRGWSPCGASATDEKAPRGVPRRRSPGPIRETPPGGLAR